MTGQITGPGLQDTTHLRKRAFESILKCVPVVDPHLGHNLASGSVGWLAALSERVDEVRSGAWRGLGASQVVVADGRVGGVVAEG